MNDDSVSVGNVALHYDRRKPYSEPLRRATWTLNASDGHGKVRIAEEDVPLERVLAIADLIGTRDRCIELMREEARALKEAANKRLIATQKSTRKEQERALEEQRQSRQLAALIAAS